MANVKANNRVGDSKVLPLMPSRPGLHDAAEQANMIPADVATSSTYCTASSELGKLKAPGQEQLKGFSCRQTVWISFFFDGTGNNLDADIGFFKHSNVAKLYRSRMPEKKQAGIYSIYIPGVATYFPAVGDDGGSTLGKVIGAMGEARINYALKEMDTRLCRHRELARAPTNAIHEINIGVFGFSRGSALARAFVNKLIETRCTVTNGKFALTNGNLPLRVRFMGLFDTVASVGRPMSSGTTDTLGAATSNVRRMIEQRLEDYEEVRPQSLAFAEHGHAGADPAMGSSHGHKSYGGMLGIDEGVEEVRHFIAAHEMRNSFPVESVSVVKNGRIIKPAHFHETVYPGVHSDVGGSYAPDEGGKSPTQSKKFGVIPLTHMYQYALRAGVPLLLPGAWDADNTEDFSADANLTATYDAYLKTINASGTLGQVMNNHMQHYFAWRFRSIRLKQSGDKSEAGDIAAATTKFKAASVPIDGKLRALQANIDAARMHISDLESQIREYEMDGDSASSKANAERLRGDLEQARARYEQARQTKLKEQARRDTLPDMANFKTLVDLYDAQLLRDAQAILNVLSSKPGRADRQPAFTRADLRPHYRVLLDAYEAEFVHRKGLTDETIIRFFDAYIHDSLAGFGSDATLPSDPRVVYLGGDEKLRYASLENDDANTQAA